jgi:hypothetical protein
MNKVLDPQTLSMLVKHGKAISLTRLISAAGGHLYQVLTGQIVQEIIGYGNQGKRFIYG